ncbi:unnamed protein product [Paramecium sonneborni]|uniref:PHD-type domain-containing protein n=1 Tax=Paramecium sonneborni TaxID=65129 RepID=A0A8S1N6N3_9CILI|nr:unnamed protein product [Paramecium sonneborni]
MLINLFLKDQSNLEKDLKNFVLYLRNDIEKGIAYVINEEVLRIGSVHSVSLIKNNDLIQWQVIFEHAFIKSIQRADIIKINELFSLWIEFHQKGQRLSIKGMSKIYCYGYNNLDEQCDPCQDNVEKPECYICGQNGLLKRVSGYHEMYVHVLCAIFDPNIWVRDYHTMSFSLQNKIDKKTKEKCQNCDNQGAQIKCQDCTTFAHPHCILKEKVEKELQLIENQQWIFNLKFHDSDLDPSIIDVGNQEIQNELYDIQEAFQNAIEMIYEIPQQNENLIIKLKDEVQFNLETIFENYSLPKSNENCWSSENKVESYCQSHMESHMIFCICRKSLNNSQMVQCDHCYEWFHFGCIKKRLIKEESYVCEACKRWSIKRCKIDIDDPQLLSLEDLLIPNDIYKVHLLDLLPILLYMEAIMRRLQRLPLSKADFKNLKLIKQFLASMPIKSSAEIQLDKILLRQKLLEELKQQMLFIIPVQLEKNKSFFEELIIQLKNKGYLFEKYERKDFKSFILSRKQIKFKIKKGINDGYLVANTFNLLEENLVDIEKLFIYQNQNLFQLINRYIVSQNIKNQFKQLFNVTKFQWDIPCIESQLELILFKQYILMKNQKSKPFIEKLIELKKMAYKSNITMGCIKLIEKIIEECLILENVNIQTNLQQIIEFPFNSDKLLNNIQSHFETQLIEEFTIDLEQKILKNCHLTEREYMGLYSFENIKKAAQRSQIIGQVFNQLVEINEKFSNQEKITNEFCTEMLNLTENCLLTTEYIENQKIKLRQFKEFDKKLKEILSIKELEEIENKCKVYGFELETESRMRELIQARNIVERKGSIIDNLDQYRYLKSRELEEYIELIQQQIEFIRQFYYIAYNHQENLQIMLQKVKEIKDLDFSNELISQVIIPEIVFDEIKQIVQNFRQIHWRYECQRLLNQSNSIEQECGKKRYNIVQVMKLLNCDSQIQDHYYLMQMQKIKSQYENWLQTLREFELQLQSCKAPEQYLLIKLLNSNQYDDPALQSQLWSFYIQMLWMQKAEEFLESKANVISLRTLINCSHVANIKQNNQLLNKLKENLDVIQNLNQKMKEFQEQRMWWLRNREQINHLQTYKQYYEFLENKLDAEQMNEILMKAKQYSVYKLKELEDDLQEVKIVLYQYNDLVQQQPENNVYIQQLQKTRTFYCRCFLKVQGFSLQLMYNMIKQQSLRNLKLRSSNDSIQERLNEIDLLVVFGGEEWEQKLLGINKQRQRNTNSADLKFIDYSLRDDFEWIGWLKESLKNKSQNKKQLKEEKIEKKKLEQMKVDVILEEERKISRELITKMLHTYKNWRKVNEQSIMNLEAQIFMEMRGDKEKYLKEIDKIKSIIKLNIQKDLLYEEMRKIKYQGVKNNAQKQQKRIVQKQQQQQQNNKIVKITSQSIIPQIICKKLIEQIEPKQQNQIEVQNKIGNETQQQQNVDYQIEGSKIEEKQVLMNIGELNIMLKKKSNENRDSWLIRPSLLTYDHNQTQYFPRTELITVTCETYSSVKTVIEYLTQKNTQFRMIIGWVYSKNIAVAGDIFNLADKLKYSKQCVGTKQGNVGLTLIYYDFLKKLKPVTKWILLRDQFENEQIMSNLQNYHTLEKFKARLCFVYYIKECKICINTIISQPVDYIDVMEEPKLKNIIDDYKCLQKQHSIKSNNVDQIKEENKDGDVQQNQSIHTMLMEIPNIFTLLNQ